jgi:hypothetical protein
MLVYSKFISKWKRSSSCRKTSSGIYEEFDGKIHYIIYLEILDQGRNSVQKESRENNKEYT